MILLASLMLLTIGNKRIKNLNLNKQSIFSLNNLPNRKSEKTIKGFNNLNRIITNFFYFNFSKY